MGTPYIPKDETVDDFAFFDANLDELVEPGMECPNCGESCMEHLANRDGVVTCQTCATVYDLEPERREDENR